MHEDLLPRTVDLRRLGDAGLKCAGSLPVAALERLGEVLEAVEGAARADIQITRDVGAVLVSGRIDAELPLRCQRCLGIVLVPVCEEFEVAVVASERDAEGLDDAFVAPEMQLALHALLEEELLLGLPVVARHTDESECVARDRHFGPPGEPKPERENPFAVLAELKRRDDE